MHRERVGVEQFRVSSLANAKYNPCFDPACKCSAEIAWIDLRLLHDFTLASCSITEVIRDKLLGARAGRPNDLQEMLLLKDGSCHE